MEKFPLSIFPNMTDIFCCCNSDLLKTSISSIEFVLSNLCNIPSCLNALLHAHGFSLILLGGAYNKKAAYY